MLDWLAELAAVSQEDYRPVAHGLLVLAEMGEGHAHVEVLGVSLEVFQGCCVEVDDVGQ